MKTIGAIISSDTFEQGWLWYMRQKDLSLHNLNSVTTEMLYSWDTNIWVDGHGQ